MRAHQQAHLDRLLAAIGHLNGLRPFVPQAMRGNLAGEFLADRGDVHRMIKVEQDRAEQLRPGLRPVLERVLEEALRRHDEPAVIPQAHDHVSSTNVFDAAPFSVEDDDVVD
ncbi:hypothetical protein GCM10011494_28900 [Novosphingobium endophyticum]|uniref:Uncharacterized protein n=1 Tax=Novosphingobium endophyticum TaxID=1955250 RepID=A0A916X5G2_9SPHN|nr:hypothetical protein GCM10011494_28900 [Novosphingobium endophyticum]